MMTAFDWTNIINDLNDLKEFRARGGFKAGSLEPLISTVRMTPAGGVIASRQLNAYSDKLGGTDSGFVTPGVTNADANFFNGKVPAGETIIALGMGATVCCDGAMTAQDADAIVRNISLTIMLRNQEVRCGAAIDYPDVLGNRGLGKPSALSLWQFPITLEGNDDFAVTVKIERPITVSLPATPYDLRLRIPAVRLYSTGSIGKA